MTHTARKKYVGEFRGVILYRQDRKFTDKEIKNWETHYGEKLTQVKVHDDMNGKPVWLLAEKNWKSKYGVDPHWR